MNNSEYYNEDVTEGDTVRLPIIMKRSGLHSVAMLKTIRRQQDDWRKQWSKHNKFDLKFGKEEITPESEDEVLVTKTYIAVAKC